MNDNIYKSWKPLRNHLSKLDPKTSLETLRYYSLFTGNLQELPPTPPAYIEVDQSIFTQNNGIYPWDIEILAREVVYSCDDLPHGEDLRKWKTFSKAMNLLKNIDNSVSKDTITQNNVLAELFRIAHRQFPYQLNALSADVIVRYSKLFLHGSMREITEYKLGCELSKILTIGLQVVATYKQFAAIEEPSQGLPELGITKNDIIHFFALFSSPYDQLREQIVKKHNIDDTFFYQYNPLTAKPLVKFTRNNITTYVCASVPRLEAQITRGLYYNLYDDKRFDNAFGKSFEYYVGTMLKDSLKNSKSKIFSEEVDTSDNKRRCDWIIDQPGSFVILECKTKRMAMPGYTIINNDIALIEELGKLADAVVQSYEAYLVYKSIGYSPRIYPYTSTKNPSICITTLEKWFLFGRNLDKLREIVIEKLSDKSIDPTIIHDVPYAIVSVEELEKLAFLISKGYDLTTIIRKHADPTNDIHTWEFSTYVQDEFKEIFKSYEYIYKDQMDKVFTYEAQSLFELNDRLNSAKRFERQS